MAVNRIAKVQKFDVLKTIKAHYAFLKKEFSEHRSKLDVEAEFNRRYEGIQSAILSDDLSYLEWRLEDLIAYEESEAALRGKDYDAPSSGPMFQEKFFSRK